MESFVSPKKLVIMVMLISIFYIGIVFYSDLSNLLNNFKNIQLIYLPIILSLVILSIYVKSERQRFLLKKSSILISAKNSFIIFNSGQTLLATPGGMGSLIKSYLLKKKYDIPMSKSVPMILAERYYDLLGITSIILTCLIFQFNVYLLLPIVFVLTFMIIITLMIKSKLIIKLVAVFEKIKLKKLVSGVSEHQKSISYLISKPIFVMCLPFSILCWSIDALAVYFCFISFDLNFNIFETTLLSQTPLILGTLSFLPGGIGVTETSMIGMIVQLGINLPLATSLVLFIRLTTMWFSTILGFITMKFGLK